MKEALTLFMLAMLVLPLLVAVRRIRRLPRPAETRRPDPQCSAPEIEPADQHLPDPADPS